MYKKKSCKGWRHIWWCGGPSDGNSGGGGGVSLTGGGGDESGGRDDGDADGMHPTTKTHRWRRKSTEDGHFIPSTCVDVEDRRTEKLNYTTLAADGYNVFPGRFYSFQQDIGRVARDDTTLVMRR